MRHNRYIAIPCVLSMGMLPSERFVEIQLANNSTHTSVVPRHFCWNLHGKLVAENEPTTDAKGFLAARVVDHLPGNQTAVEIPDGTVIAVDDSTIVDRPTLIQPPSSPLSTC